MNNTVLETKNLTKTYISGKQPFDALKNVSLKINKGEAIAIVGKSGSGKSTLMHQLALLDTPTSGEILISNELSTGLSSKKVDKIRNESFGFVFQQFFLNGNDSVINNVILPLKVSGISPKNRIQKAKEALRAVDLEGKENNRANDLSGGQKQRVCIARAIVNNPKIIFADEPTGNLDSKTGEKIEKLLFKLRDEQKITVIIVTHDSDLAKKCDRQILIKDGKLISGGTK
jgi:putative ABC transport system ATP-binding protein